MNATAEGNGAPQIDQGPREMMTEYGIVLKPVDYFHYKGYRYTSLKDAIAQARRDAEASKQTP